MTEAKEFSFIWRKDSFGTKLLMAETVCPTPQICEICGICGFNFGIWV